MLCNANTNEAGGVSVFTRTVYRRNNGRIHMGYVADAQGYDEGFSELKKLIKEMTERDGKGVAA